MADAKSTKSNCPRCGAVVTGAGSIPEGPRLLFNGEPVGETPRVELKPCGCTSLSGDSDYEQFNAVFFEKVRGL
jgi:hypothetical protein